MESYSSFVFGPVTGASPAVDRADPEVADVARSVLISVRCPSGRGARSGSWSFVGTNATSLVGFDGGTAPGRHGQQAFFRLGVSSLLVTAVD